MKIYKSDALEAVHETASGLYEAGLLSQKDMRAFRRELLNSHRKTGARRNQSSARRSVRQPNGVRALFGRDARFGFAMGARRAQAERPGAQTVEFGET